MFSDSVTGFGIWKNSVPLGILKQLNSNPSVWWERSGWDVTKRPTQLQANRCFLNTWRQGFRDTAPAVGKGALLLPPASVLPLGLMGGWSTAASLAGTLHASSSPHADLSVVTLLVNQLNQQAKEIADIALCPSYRGGKWGPKMKGIVPGWNQKPCFPPLCSSRALLRGQFLKMISWGRAAGLSY